MLTIIFGTRPEYIKIQPLIRKLNKNQIEYSLIQISQHENIDTTESSIIYLKLENNTSISRLSLLSSEIIKSLDHALVKTSYVLVQGDTATAFFSALAAFHKKIPVFHLEAGLRTQDIHNPFPEEGYRSMLSRIATYHLCPDVGASYNLKKENIINIVYIIRNTILDVIKLYNLIPIIGNEVIITIHRRENWESLLNILKEINCIAANMNYLSFTWVLHPNPSIRSQIHQYTESNMIASNISFSEPLTHFEMATRIASAYCLITDSGGIQEEASYLGKHCFVIRKTTERDSLPLDYITLIPNINDMYSIITKYKIKLLPSCNTYGNGTASDQFVQIYRDVTAKYI